MMVSDYDETRATARLPNLDIEILHRRPWEGNEEHLVVTLRAVPSFEAFGRVLEASNPLLAWTRMMQTAWSPWLGGFTAALSMLSREPSIDRSMRVRRGPRPMLPSPIGAAWT